MREQDLTMNLSQNSEMLLAVQDISFVYDNRKIISNINLTLNKNELVSLLGVSAIRKANDMLREFKLESYAKKYPKELSGGMRQRIALLRTYLFSKDVSLLDEPFSALDAITKDEMHEWYMNMRKRYNTSTIFITHDVDEAILLSDRIYILGGKPATIIREIKINVDNRINNFRLSKEFLEYKKDILKNLEN